MSSPLLAPYFTRLRALISEPADLDPIETRAADLDPAAGLRLVASIAKSEVVYAPGVPSADVAAALLAIEREARAEADAIEQRRLDVRVDRACGIAQHKIGTAPAAGGAW